MKAKINFLISLMSLVFGLFLMLIFGFLTSLFMPYLNIVVSLVFLALIIIFSIKDMKVSFLVVMFFTVLIQWFPVYFEEDKLKFGYMYSNTKGMEGLWFYILFFNVITILGVLFVSIGIDGFKKHFKMIVK